MTEHIRRHALGRAAYPVVKLPDLESLKKTEWFSKSEPYRELEEPTKSEPHRRATMIQGRFRYGHFKDPKQPKFDRIESAIKRLQDYQKPEGGNTAHLIDVLNLVDIEFEKPNHPNHHFNTRVNIHHVTAKKPLK